MATQRQIWEAMLKDNAGVGRLQGGGGAMDEALARDKMNFARSQLGMLLAGTPQFDEMFNRLYRGGSVDARSGNFDKVFGGSSTPSAPHSSGQRASMGRTGMPTGERSPVNLSPNDILMQLLTEAERERLAAKQANIDKFDRGDMMFQDRTKQVMNEIANWGEAGKIDLNERARDTIHTQLAQNAATGLGNSSLEAALRQRNAMDLAREQLRHSENISNRKASSYADLTKDHADFVERRDDIPPDLGQIYALAQQLGQSGNGQGYGGQNVVMATGERSPVGQRPQMTPWGPVQPASYYPQGRAPVHDNIFPLNPIAAQAAMVGGVAPQRQMVGSNRYPAARSPEFYQQLQYNMQQNSAANQQSAARRNRGQRILQNRINRPYNPNLNYV